MDYHQFTGDAYTTIMKKILYLLLFLPTICFAQGGYLTSPLLTPTGAYISFPPNVTVSSASITETSLIGAVKDTIKANTLIPNRPYRFELYAIVTTPAISLPTLSLKVKLGGNTVAMISATSVAGGLTNAGIRIRGIIVATSVNTQLVLTEILQPNGGILAVGNSNANFYSSLTTDMTVPQVLDITAQWGGLTGVATIKSVLYLRPDF
jgi:hypothetical protein